MDLNGKAFCKVLKLALTAPDTEIWKLTLESGPLLDALGLEIPIPVEGSDLFFLDYHPEANWAHPCGFCALTDYGLAYYAAEWPPHESVLRTRLTATNSPNRKVIQ